MTNTPTTAAWTWGQTVATTGTGPTATVEIDVRVPGRSEPEPVVVPLADARVLHAMLGDAIRELSPGGDTIVEQPAPADLAAIRVEAFQEAAEKLAGLDPAKAALAGESAWKTAAGVVRHMAVQERRMADGEQPADGPSRVADEAQQPETQAHPPETYWQIETQWHTGDWRSWAIRTEHDDAVREFETVKDGTHAWRLVRFSRVSAVEAAHAAPQPGDAEAAEVTS